MCSLWRSVLQIPRCHRSCCGCPSEWGWLEQRIRSWPVFLPTQFTRRQEQCRVSYFGPSSIGGSGGCSGLCEGLYHLGGGAGFLRAYPVHFTECQKPLINILSSLLKRWRSVFFCLIQRILFWCCIIGSWPMVYDLTEQGYILPPCLESPLVASTKFLFVFSNSSVTWISQH